MQPGMRELVVTGKRRRIVPEEVQADGKAIAADEAEPADQAGPSYAGHTPLVPEQPQRPRRLQPERVHLKPVQSPDLALPVEVKAPGNPPSAGTAAGDSSERSAGSDADSEPSDASMSETDQPLQDDEELCSDDEVESQDADSESLQATSASQGQASSSGTLSSPEDAPAAAGELLVACQNVQGMGLAVARACQVYVANQHTKSVTSWVRSQRLDGKLRCWQQEGGQEAPAVQQGQLASRTKGLRPVRTAEDMWASGHSVAASGAA